MFLRFVLFFFSGTASTEIYTLSLHDALPICEMFGSFGFDHLASGSPYLRFDAAAADGADHRRSEEHTSELQSHSDLVCRLLLEKKKHKKEKHKEVKRNTTR